MKIKVEMKIRNKTGNDKNITVECYVADISCKDKKCLAPGKYVHRGKSIDGNVSTWQDDFFSCMTRNYRGCPD